ncbi:MAG: hypothetical protein H0T50_15230 [Gemmatimonadales bacterium]|nr:hypothetical protein [Gemmatimonadales bacterium]
MISPVGKPEVTLKALVALALALSLPCTSSAAQTCEEPYRVPRQTILQAMRAHGPYSLTSTTTSMLFGANALLEIVH